MPFKTNIMKCKHCGEEIANNSRFCEYCGESTSLPNVTCSASLVKWLLYGVMFVLCADNLLFLILLSNVDVFIFSIWWIIPFLSLAICFVSMVLTMKKKIPLLFTIVMFLLFGANTTQIIVALQFFLEGMLYVEDMVLIVITVEGGILVLYLIGSAIFSSVVARKRLRQK